MLRLVFIVLVLFAQAQSAPGDRAYQEPKPSPNQQQTDEIAPSPQPAHVVSAIDNRASANKGKDTKKKPSRVCRAFAPEYWSQWALVVIGGIGVAGGLISLNLLGKQVKIQERALIAAENASNAAKESADIAGKSLVMVQRARLAVSGLKFIISEETKTFKYSFFTDNTGKSPATIFEMNFSWMGFQSTDSEKGFLKDMESPKYGGPPI